MSDDRERAAFGMSEQALRERRHERLRGGVRKLTLLAWIEQQLVDETITLCCRSYPFYSVAGG